MTRRALPYSTATSTRAVEEIEAVLRQFGCERFAHASDYAEGTVSVHFHHRGRMVHLEASVDGYAAAWLRENPWSSRRRTDRRSWERRALDQARIATLCLLRDWVRAQVTAIECGILEFDAAFLAHMALPSGRRVIEELRTHQMLPAPPEDA